MIKSNFFNLNIIKFDTTLPKESLVITYDASENPLSYFHDDVWDFKNYISSYSQTTVIDFNKGKVLSEKSKYYLKLCMYFYIYHGIKNSISLSFVTIINKYRMLKIIALLCDSFNANFADIQENKFCLNAIIDSISFDSKMNIGKYLTIFELINKVGLFYNLESFGFSQESLNKIRFIKDKSIEIINQTILIPSNILSDFIYKSSDFFSTFNRIKPELIQLIESKKFYGRAPSKGMQTPFGKLIISNDLKDYFSKFNIENRPHLISHFLYIQSLGSAFISCFSGMRKGEVCNLPYNCLEIIENKKYGDNVYILNGYTNKLSKIGLVACSWVTSKNVTETIKSLQSIAYIHKFLIDIGYIEDEINNIPLDKYPLLPIFNQQKHKVGVNPLYDYPTLTTPTLSDNIYKIIEPIVFEECDLEELSNFNLLVDWGNEYSLNVGENWKFNYHQFRRSLAVYCSRSSMVKLPALKKQLKHISFDMTLYYSNNSHNAKNIKFDDDLIKTYHNEKELFKFNSFCENVIDNSSTLFGARGTNYEILKHSNDKPVFFTDRKKTQQYIKDGRLSYKKTPLGGCSKVGECNKLSFAYATACVTCSDAIFDDDSVIALNKAKANYQKQLLKLDQDSISYKQFQIEIEAINKVLVKRNLLEVRNV